MKAKRPNHDRKNEIRRKAEEKLYSGESKQLAPERLSPDELCTLVHELQVHQIELEMQNDELRRTQEALEISRNQHANLFDFAPVGYLALTSKGLIAKMNLTLADMLGVPRGAVDRQPFSKFVSKASQDDYYLFLRRLATDNAGVASCEVSLAKSDGALFYALLEGGPMKDAEKDDIENTGIYLATVNDVTELKKSRNQLEQAKSTAEHALEMRTNFLANMSHEIRTPMGVVVGMCDLALKTKQEAERVSYMKAAKEAAENLLRLINDILDFSKIDADELVLEEQPFNLRQTFEDAVRVLNLDAEKKGLELACRMTDEADVSVFGDSGRLRQTLVNLVGNAVKFTESGFVHVDAEITETTKDKALFHFIISDTGKGIPEDQYENVLKNFMQIGGSSGGVGLGLAISKKLIEMTGGRIWIESKLGSGTSVHFTARYRIEPSPKKSEHVFPEEYAERRIFVLNNKASETNEEKRIAPLNVLLAEDDYLTSEMERIMLTNLGHRVQRVGNGLKALEAMSHGDFDIVFMDVRMPVMDGLAAVDLIRKCEKGLPPDIKHGEHDELLQELGKRIRGKHTPIVALTAYAMAKYQKQSYDAGVDEHLTKPFNEGQIIAVLERLGNKGSKHIEPDPEEENRLASASEASAELLRFVLTENFGLNADKLEKMIILARESFKNDLNRIRTALDEESMIEISAAAHRLGGALAHFGLVQLSETAHRLETLSIKGGDYELLRELNKKLSLGLRSFLTEKD